MNDIVYNSTYMSFCLPHFNLPGLPSLELALVRNALSKVLYDRADRLSIKSYNKYCLRKSYTIRIYVFQVRLNFRRDY